MKRKTMAGFTVEAAVVMPVVLYTVVFIIYLSFYLYDYCRLKSIADMVLHKASMNLKYGADIGSGRVDYGEINSGLLTQIFENYDAEEGAIENYLMKLLSDGFMASRIINIQADKDFSKLTVRVEAEFMFPLKGLQWMIAGDNKLVVEAGISNHHPAEVVRMSEVILDTGSKLKGCETLKECLKRLIP
ncbi:MAG: pilus assembly protein [Clostridiales bacterium]|nr:pilus assembly protein [Clostridiales bacterium]